MNSSSLAEQGWIIRVMTQDTPEQAPETIHPATVDRLLIFAAQSMMIKQGHLKDTDLLLETFREVLEKYRRANELHAILYHIKRIILD